MSNRLQQIKDTAPRVVPSLATPHYWRPAGKDKNPSEGAVVALADFAWMIGVIENVEPIMRERNTWARQLADANDEAATAKTEAEKARTHQGEALDWATTRVADLEVAIQRVLETTKDTDNPMDTLRELRNLRAVWARA